MNVDVAALAPSPRPRASAAAGRPSGESRLLPAPAAVLIAVAWVLAIAGSVTGAAQYFGHDAVGEGGLPPIVGVGLFLIGWLLMVLAMMLPTTAPALARRRWGAFLGGFVLVWAVAGLAALGTDMLLHRVVHGVPALEARPWLVAAGVLALAGVIQLLPSTRRSIAAPSTQSPGPAFAAGQHHGTRCLRSDGPLMLVMFAVGADLAWMAILTALMVGERSSRSGRRVAVAVGLALLVTAAVVALHRASLLPA